MKIHSVHLRNIRCFEDSGEVLLGPGCNILVGQNNAGKSTLLKSIVQWQMAGFTSDDMRPKASESFSEMKVRDLNPADDMTVEGIAARIMAFRRYLSPHGNENGSDFRHQGAGVANPIFKSRWPRSFLVPFSANRKASGFDQSVNSSVQEQINGTFSNLYARIDRVVSPGTDAHTFYKNAVEEILGVFITTTASPSGKIAGYYYNEMDFIRLDQMGDGVAEIVALLVDLSLAENKLFVLEEPETNLHPKGLRALLELISLSSKRNQFVIATHSNVVVRELAADPETRIFRIFKDGNLKTSPSLVEQVPNEPESHRELLSELGYGFADYDLYDAWLFLEESSAERIIREFLIKWFTPSLARRLRTFSAGGVSGLEPTIREFQRLITFIHLQPVYRDRIWVRADGDSPGIDAVSLVQKSFPYLGNGRAKTFICDDFEMYYPVKFRQQVEEVLAITDRQAKRNAKRELLQEVVTWSQTDPAARTEWAKSAEEPIRLLEEIQETLS